MHRPGIEDERLGGGRIRARAVCRDCGEDYPPVGEWHDDYPAAREDMRRHEQETR